MSSVSPFKKNENELMPQYFKLEKKILTGAQYVITQIGFDSRKWHELLSYLKYQQIQIPVVANVYILTPRIAKIFHDDEVPGVVVSDKLLSLADHQGKSPDKGKSFFYELAAKQILIAQGLGFQGVYLGGIHRMEDYKKLLDILATFQKEDWKLFAKELQFPLPDTFYFFEQDPDTGLNNPNHINSQYLNSLSENRRYQMQASVPLNYKFSRWVHNTLFDKKSNSYKKARDFYTSLEINHPLLEKFLYEIEKMGKVPLFDCRDCGDCSLPEIAYLCPESQCVKNQRNGPCGGTRQGLCELDNGKNCIWSRAYDRLKPYNEEKSFIHNPVVIKDNALEGTSAWKNNFLGKDHST